MIEHDGCVGCKYENEPETFEHCYRCTQNAVDRYTPATNADRIRNMSDEELAGWILNMQEEIWNALCATLGWEDSKVTDISESGTAFLDYLRQPAKEGGNEV